jgi:AmmeMemoRadiSam system protein A
MHPIVELAKKSIESYIREGKILKPPVSPSPEMSGKAGVFVCIKKQGELRGCIGTFTPVYDSIAMETIMNAISAATKDPRFQPVQEDELNGLNYSVDVLTSPEKVSGIGDLDPKKYGVIVQSGHRRGLLLPDLEGVDSAEDQIRITKLKAGILPGEDIEISRFKVRRYNE